MGIIVWTPEQTTELRALWPLEQGHSVSEIGRRLGFSKNAVIGKSNRIGLEKRKSPIGAPRTPEKCDRIETMLRNGMAVSVIAKRTFSDINYVRATRVSLGLPARQPSWSRATPPRIQTLDLFDDPTFEAKPEREASAHVVPFIAPPAPRIARGGCQYPMWNHNERAKLSPDGMALVCEAAIVRGTYCTEHAALCYSRKIAA